MVASRGVLEAKAATLCDSAYIAAASPVPICSNLRREIELPGTEPPGSDGWPLSEALAETGAFV
jgi:hypothetical protein